MARERLLAVKESTELGSGFRLAMRDLEIRGAGNLLGAEQHGHVAAVGLDLYTRLLAEAVAKLKGTKPPADMRDVTVETKGEATLPKEYVPAERQRLELYRRISETTTGAQLKGVFDEIRDRFGPPPAPAERLVELQELRILAQPTPVEKLALRDGEVELELAPETKLTPASFPAFDFVTGVNLGTVADGKRIRINITLGPAVEPTETVKKILAVLAAKNEE
jgi:transcription-repair coupling factor (superfamily II helicase)